MEYKEEGKKTCCVGSGKLDLGVRLQNWSLSTTTTTAADAAVKRPKRPLDTWKISRSLCFVLDVVGS